MQNQNLYQTTIKRQNSTEEVTIQLKGYRNSRYVHRIITLHPDGETYDYIHEYDYKLPSEHSNKRSVERWQKYNRILEAVIEINTIEDN